MSKAFPTIALATALLLGLLSAAWTPLTIIGIPGAHGTPRNIALSGTIAAWNGTNPTITLEESDTVTLSLTSGDGAPHRFYIELTIALYISSR